MNPEPCSQCAWYYDAGERAGFRTGAVIGSIVTASIAVLLAAVVGGLVYWAWRASA